jgi:hypothetical protein
MANNDNDLNLIADVLERHEQESNLNMELISRALETAHNVAGQAVSQSRQAIQLIVELRQQLGEKIDLKQFQGAFELVSTMGESYKTLKNELVARVAKLETKKPIEIRKTETDLEWRDDGEWQTLLSLDSIRGKQGKKGAAGAGAKGESGNAQYASYLNFPSVGDANILYIDKDSSKVYRWDADDLRYYVAGSNYEDISVINGGLADG